MIEVNLLPDVKRELLHAQRVRTAVVSVSMIIAVVSVSLVGVILLWMLAQEGRELLLKNSIDSNSKKLNSVSAINDAVTIQNQLGSIDQLHNNKKVSSRMFDMLTAINPPSPNNIAITNLTVDTEKKTVKMEAQATGGYAALETFRKTIAATKIEFKQTERIESVPLASDIGDSERSLGENTDGKKVLRFILVFTFDDKLFDNVVENVHIIGPNEANVTDSYVGVPSSLFTESVSADKAGN